MRKVVIANPKAGQRRREELAALMQQADSVAEQSFTTEAAGDAEEIARRITQTNSADVIIAVGGDGTLNEIANGIVGVAEGHGGSRPALCIVASGTSNILATELGLSQLSLTEQIGLLEVNKRRSIDLGFAGGRAFLLMAGFGFDAAIVQNVALPLKDIVGQHAYLLSALTTLANYRHSSITLEIDGDAITSDAYMALIANVSSYANSSMKLAPFAAVDDGWLDICVFEKAAVAKLGFVTQFFMMLAHRHLDDPKVRYFRGKKITVSAAPPVFAQLDGDSWGETPLTIELRPKALQIFVPA